MEIHVIKFVNMGLGSRAIQSLFDAIEDETEVRTDRADVLAKRDECVAARAYYYLHIKKLNYMYTVEILSGEFYLSELTIGRIITRELGTIQALITTKANAKELSGSFPHFNWGAL